MKKLVVLFAAFLVLIACKEQENNADSETSQNQTEEVNKPTLDGVWELVSFYNYEDNAIKDTVINSPDNRQVKIYKDGKVMWSRRAPSDQIDYFGYGSYTITDSSLREVLDYGSVAMLKVIDTMRVFDFELYFDKDTFTQIQLDPDGDRVFSENYIRIKEE